MKVLIAVDDSPQSERAIRFVTRMRWPGGSRMMVTHVRAPDAASAPAGLARPSGEPALPRRRRDDVIHVAQSVLREAGLSTEGRVVEGDARDQLVQLAACERWDLIVVGSRGRRGLTRFFLGSVSSHVVSHAPCSVLVVKPPIGEEPGPLEDSATQKRSATGGTRGDRP